MALGNDAGCLVLSWNRSKSTPCLLVRHKYRHTNHHAAASLSFKFVPALLGATHDTNATRPTTSTTAPPCPPPTRCAGGPTRAVACEADFFFVSSSALCRRWCVKDVQELPQMPRTAEKQGRVSSAPRENMTWKERDPLFSERAWWPSCASMGPNASLAGASICLI